MKTQTSAHYTRQEWMRSLGFSALCGVAAIALWFVILLSTRGMSQALSMTVRQSVWLLPSVIIILGPVLLIAGKQKSSSLESGS
jgi:hypothetical protein